MPRTKSKKAGVLKRSKSKSKSVVKNNSNNASKDNVVARCMKCRKQMKMLNGKVVTMKNGRNAMKGNCVCGTTMFRII